ncbi:MAG TPA: hypothetical protein VGI81_19380 [Tepidisphaeraceae bacterium]|jgi:hypothetical protein
MTTSDRILKVIRSVGRLPFATAASAVLLACLVALISVSVWRCQLLAFFTQAGHLQGLAAGRAGILLFRSEIPFGAEYGWTARHASLTPQEYGASIVVPLYESGEKWHSLGFGVADSSLSPVPGERWHYSIIVIPYWLLLVPLLPLPYRGIRNLIVRGRRSRAGCCLACGYDLRQSPVRCPECGMPKWSQGSTRRVFGGIVRVGVALVPEMLIAAALAFALDRGVAIDRAGLARALAMAKLDRRLARFTVPPGTRVTDALELLHRASGVSLDVDWPALAIPNSPFGPREGRLSLPVELRLRDVTAADALDAILGQADMFSAHEAGFAPEGGGRVLVTLPSQFPLLCRIYDVHDVTASVDAFDALDATSRATSTSGGGAAADLERASIVTWMLTVGRTMVGRGCIIRSGVG